MFRGTSVDPRLKYQEVPCGKCMLCRIERTREWKNRLLLELDYWDEACFITLTYNEENLPMDHSLDKKELQNFFKRLRRRLGDKKIKYYAVGEYGDLHHRPHYHAIIFGCQNKEYIEDSWPFGFVQVGAVEHDSIQYVTGYIRKKLFGDMAKEVYGERTPPFSNMSQGLGLRFVQDNEKELRKNLGYTLGGVQQGLPRYFVKKLEIEQDVIRKKAKESKKDKIKEAEKYFNKSEEELNEFQKEVLYDEHMLKVNDQRALDLEVLYSRTRKREI